MRASAGSFLGGLEPPMLSDPRVAVQPRQAGPTRLPATPGPTSTAPPTRKCESRVVTSAAVGIATQAGVQPAQPCVIAVPEDRVRSCCLVDPAAYRAVAQPCPRLPEADLLTRTPSLKQRTVFRNGQATGDRDDLHSVAQAADRLPVVAVDRVEHQSD